MWDLPTSVEIDGKIINIRDKCDYRVVLDVISVLNDNELDDESKIKCSLFIFYDNNEYRKNIQSAIDEMMKVINLGETSKENDDDKPKMMDWEHDFKNLAPPVSRVLGYSVRDKNNYTHWYDFIGAYVEIGDCYFSQIINIRQKLYKGKKLDKTDMEFYKSHKKDINLPNELSQDDKDWLDSDW